MKLLKIAEDKNNESYLLYESKDRNLIKWMVLHKDNDYVEIYEKVKDLNVESVVHLRKIDVLNLYDTLKEA